MNNPGSAPAYPVILFTGPGRIYQLTNISTRQEINIDYTLQTGEQAVLDLRKKTFVSTFFGSLLTRGAILRGSNLADWRLLPGENDVSLFTESTVTSFISFDILYLSFDG